MPILKLHIVWISNHSSNTSYNLSILRCNFILRTQDCHNLHGEFAKNQSIFIYSFINPFCKLVVGMTNCDWKLWTCSYTRFCTLWWRQSHMQGWTGLWMLLTAPPTSVQSEGDQLTANNKILLWHQVLKVPSETSLNNHNATAFTFIGSNN